MGNFSLLKDSVTENSVLFDEFKNFKIDPAKIKDLNSRTNPLTNPFRKFFTDTHLIHVHFFYS